MLEPLAMIQPTSHWVGYLLAYCGILCLVHYLQLEMVKAQKETPKPKGEEMMIESEYPTLSFSCSD